MNFLLLRGLTREKSHWGSFFPKMKRQFPDSVVHCLDLPGTGSENKRPSPRTVAGITDDLRKRWRASFSKAKLGDWICIGHSLGGMVALDWRYRYPKDFVGTVTINSTSRGFSSPFKRLQPSAIPSFLRVAVSRDVNQIEAITLGLVSNERGKDQKILKEWLGFAKERPINSQTPLNQVLAALTFKARPVEGSPLLILAGKGDRLANYQCSIDLQKKLGGELRLHENAGHDIALDDPEWLVDQLTEFEESLQKTSKAAAR